ncbi:acyl-CoA-binding domain-containing protein 6-like isoform X2 [Wolffia australiana]
MAPTASPALAEPDKFASAAAYLGFGSSQNPSSVGAISRFPNDVALLLYGLYQQATVGPCNVPKPRAWNAVEHGKWTSWDGLGNLASSEAMRLFVKILEEEDPTWYSEVPRSTEEPAVEEGVHKANEGSLLLNASSKMEPAPTTLENRHTSETEDKDIILEGIAAVNIYDQWTGPSVSGWHPKPRYKHGAAMIEDKMYIFGGNHNGRYLADLQVFDLKSLIWEKIDAKATINFSDKSEVMIPTACAGHSLVSCERMIILVGGHTKQPWESIIAWEFDPQSLQWSKLKTQGKTPVSRGGHSVTLVGKSLVLFGGEDEGRCLLNDLHILDLDSLTWKEVDLVGQPPAPRMDHTAALHAERYLLIFGGASHATCFNDLHVLDLKTMEWSRPRQQGIVPAPRAGHAGVTIGENWFIVGGGDNKNGISETLVLNMSTLVWSVVTVVQGRVPLASEGLSLVASSYSGEDILISFGGYNGRYCNEIYALKPSHKTALQSKIFEEPLSESLAGLPTHPTRDIERELEISQDGTVREIMMDSIEPALTSINHAEVYEQQIAKLKAEKEELALIVLNEQSQMNQLKQELSEVEARKSELMKELQSVRSQLAAEQSRCFKLEVGVAEMRQKLQAVESLQTEVELLRRQKAVLEEAVVSPKLRHGSGGVWGWLAGTPPNNNPNS